MPGPARTTSFRPLKSRVLPWLVLAAGIALSVAIWISVRREIERQDVARFERLKERVLDAIDARFLAAEQALFGGRALVEVAGELSQPQWVNFVNSVWPFFDRGVIGLGYAQRLRRDELDAVKARVRAQGRPNFSAERAGTNPVVYLVTQIEPVARNAQALGKDIAAGNTRRTAAEQAMRTGAAIITRRIGLVVGSTTVPGCLLFLPVYAKGATPLDAPAREAALQGWVYASLRVDLLLESVSAIADGQLDFDAFDGNEAKPDLLLFDSRTKTGIGAAIASRDAGAGGAFSVSIPRPAYGRTWLLTLRTNRAFDQRGNRVLASFILGSGVLLSLFSAALTSALVSRRRSALQLAQDLTSDLRRAEADARRLALVASRTSNVAIIAGADWRIEWVNESFTRMFGYTFEEARGRRPDELFSGPETDAAMPRLIATGCARGEPFQGEMINYAKSGEKRWVQLEVQPLKDEAGIVIGYISLQADITERRRIQAEIAQKEAQFRFIFEAMPIGVSWRRVEADGTTIRLLNDAHTRICGYSREELAVNGTFRQISFPEEYAAQQALYARLTAGEISNFSIEKRYRHRNGQIVWVVLEQQRKIFPTVRSRNSPRLPTSPR